MHNVLQVVADQMELWQAQSQRLKTHTAQLYAKFESKEVCSRQLALICSNLMGARPLLACCILHACMSASHASAQMRSCIQLS